MEIPFFISGAIFGAFITAAVFYFRRRSATETLVNEVKATFLALSQNQTDSFLTLAGQRLSGQQQLSEQALEGKKELIDQSLADIKRELGEFRKLVTDDQTSRAEQQGQIAANLRHAALSINTLTETTGQLQNVLANAKARGQWGEKMAEDILRVAGLKEGINYRKQKALPVGRSIPDYSFLLPRNMIVNMDVKFPLDNYHRYCNCETDGERESYKKQFLRDVSARINEITTRDYIDPENNTLDYVIMFIPNDQIYSFVNEMDYGLFFANAMEKKVVVCSPLTLYAILSTIRQAMDNFNFEQTASELLTHLGKFYKQWTEYKTSYERLGNRILAVQTAFNDLTTTRTNQLERPLNKIEELRESRKLILNIEDASDEHSPLIP